MALCLNIRANVTAGTRVRIADAARTFYVTTFWLISLTLLKNLLYIAIIPSRNCSNCIRDIFTLEFYQRVIQKFKLK